MDDLVYKCALYMEWVMYSMYKCFILSNVKHMSHTEKKKHYETKKVMDN